MPHHMLARVNHALERRFPEQRIFVKSDDSTRFIRLRPLTQAMACGLGAVMVVWTIFATSVVMIDQLSSGSAREQTQRSVVEFERRLDALSSERDERTIEALRAQENFNKALLKISEMQSQLLASEDRRKEVETGLDVVQMTLRRAIRERDEARANAAALRTDLIAQGGTGSPEAERADDATASLAMLATALNATSVERDAMSQSAIIAQARLSEEQDERRKMVQRNEEIFTKLEEAVTVSMEPLDAIFRSAGLRSQDVLATVRRGYSGQGGPLGQLRLSSKGHSSLHEDELRANAILNGFDRIALYRLAMAKLPFANPVRGNFRYTSPYGYRRDPLGRGQRLHSGTDFAGARGTPIVATGEGVVVKAGWQSGYGQTVVIRHDFGIETLYAHLHEIAVKPGQSVSRGDRIGGMGNTGRSTGTHLHYEVRVDGRAVNPMTYIKAASNVF